MYVCVSELEEGGQNTHTCRLHASIILFLTLAKSLANCQVVTKWQNGIISSSGNNVCAGTDSFHLFSLK